jgi:hypothetical protein
LFLQVVLFQFFLVFHLFCFCLAGYLIFDLPGLWCFWSSWCFVYQVVMSWINFIFRWCGCAFPGCDVSVLPGV